MDLPLLYIGHRQLQLLLGIVITLWFWALNSLLLDNKHFHVDAAVKSGRLSRLPLQVEEWQANKVFLDSRTIDVANIADYFCACYKHKDTKASVTVLIVCGHQGPISCHTPDICYAGRGFRICDVNTIDVRLPEGHARFQSASFQKKSLRDTENLQIAWSWNAGDGWQVPSCSPRIAFIGRPILYKMYAIEKGCDNTASTTLLTRLLPLVHKCLYFR